MCLAKRGALFWRASCPLWLAGPAVTHTGCKRHQGSSQDRQKTAFAWGLGSSAHQPLSFSSWNSPITTLFLWECLYPQNLIGFFRLSSHIWFFSRNKRFVNLGLSYLRKTRQELHFSVFGLGQWDISVELWKIITLERKDAPVLCIETLRRKKRWRNFLGSLGTSKNKRLSRWTDLFAALKPCLCTLSFTSGCVQLAVKELPYQGINLVSWQCL